MIPKKKICIECGKETYIWARKMCKMCAMKGSKGLKTKRVTKTYQGQQMPEHTVVYMKGFGYSVGDTLISEISGLPSNDIHHLAISGMGGSKTGNTVTNLMALTRGEHELFHNYPEYREWFIFVHLNFIATRKPFYITHPNHEMLELIKKVNNVHN